MPPTPPYFLISLPIMLVRILLLALLVWAASRAGERSRFVRWSTLNEEARVGERTGLLS